MITDRSASIIVGVLFIIGTVAGSLSIVFTGPILDAPDYLAKVATSENQIVIGALLVLIMGLALALVPIVMLPIARKHNEVLAAGYLVFRGALETALYIIFVIGLLLLIPLSKEYLAAGAPDDSFYHTVGTILRSGDFQFAPMLKIVFSIGALMFYCLLYQSMLIPRWLSGWGFIGAALHLISGLLFLFGSLTEFPWLGIFWDLPIAVQEMTMAVWLIVKGFNPASLDSPKVIQQ